MTPYQEKAWSCLSKQEQESLFLIIGQNKTTWEAGEILKITHYKYLEIKERAEKFFRLFGDFFAKHEAIFRPDCPCEPQFRDYIESLIERRSSKREARVSSGDSAHLIPAVNNRCINRNMRWLKETNNEWDKDTRNLIFEFDRWNTFRILPVMLQQPSAYKRRLNRKFKAYIKYMVTRMPDWALARIQDRFWYKSKRDSKEKYWIALIYPSDLKHYKVISVRPTQEVVNSLTKFYIYVFKTKDEADTFGFLVSQFRNKSNRNIRVSQKFWPEFRLIISQAINYKEINNMDVTVQSLDNAYSIKRSPKSSKGEKPLPNEGVERAKNRIFY